MQIFCKIGVNIDVFLSFPDSSMGWEQKVMICLHGVGICAGVASGIHEADCYSPG